MGSKNTSQNSFLTSARTSMAAYTPIAAGMPIDDRSRVVIVNVHKKIGRAGHL